MGYIGMCAAVKGMVFKQFTLAQGIQIRAFGSRIYRVSFFRKLISWLKILSRPEGNRELPLKHIKKSNRKAEIYATQLVLAKLCSSFWKTATLGQGGLGEFTLVNGSKIQLNRLLYRLRVPGSEQHIPTKKLLKHPPGSDSISLESINSTEIWRRVCTYH